MNYSFLVLLILININVYAQDKIEANPQNEKNNNVFGTKEEKINNLTGYIYFLENIQKLPDFTKLKPVGKIYTNSLNIPNQDFEVGFPGVVNRFENFAIDYKGDFYLKEGGEYCFLLGSDDGSRLIIDDKVVIDHDFSHALKYKRKCINLSKGFHKIEVQYYQGPRYKVALILQFKMINDQEYKIFDLTKLYPITVNDKGNSVDISIGDELLFGFNRHELNNLSKNTIKDIKRLIIDKTQVKSIIIEGHTDDVGSEEYNKKLSIKRANSVEKYLISIGTSPELISIKGYGETNPKVPNLDDESRKVNRRIEIKLLK